MLLVIAPFMDQSNSFHKNLASDVSWQQCYVEIEGKLPIFEQNKVRFNAHLTLRKCRV